MWRYNTTHFLGLDAPCMCGSASRAGRFNLRKSSLCPKDSRLCGPHTGSWRCAVKDLCQCREYNCDFSASKIEDKLSTFSNGFRLNSMQPWHPSERAISTTQGNPGNSLNQKIHHGVQTANHLCHTWAKLITIKPSDTISGRSILILFFHLRLGLPNGLLPSSFPTKRL